MDKKPNLLKSKEEIELEKRIEGLEKRVATLEGQVQEQPKIKLRNNKFSDIEDVTFLDLENQNATW